MKKKAKKPAPKPMPRPYIVALFCALMLGSTSVFAQKAGSQDECYAFADMAIVAAALAKAGVKEPVMRGVIADIYNTVEAHAKMVDGIVAKAYTSKVAPKEFAQAFGAHCMANQGKMDGFLGVAL